ncbi:MAG TPA: hypothetical protein VLJ42_00115 [Solirubrobacteraceae bacterium]|nr:hypothetical protein [Solirubrobacteraceae bacterium]
MLLDALDALAAHRGALILVGAQAIYLHTGKADVALAETTNDSDLAIDPRELTDAPLLEVSMTAAGFHRDLHAPQPGSWLRLAYPSTSSCPRRSQAAGAEQSYHPTPSMRPAAPLVLKGSSSITAA